MQYTGIWLACRPEPRYSATCPRWSNRCPAPSEIPLQSSSWNERVVLYVRQLSELNVLNQFLYSVLCGQCASGVSTYLGNTVKLKPGCRFRGGLWNFSPTNSFTRRPWTSSYRLNRQSGQNGELKISLLMSLAVLQSCCIYSQISCLKTGGKSWKKPFLITTADYFFTMWLEFNPISENRKKLHS